MRPVQLACCHRVRLLSRTCGGVSAEILNDASGISGGVPTDDRFLALLHLASGLSLVSIVTTNLPPAFPQPRKPARAAPVAVSLGSERAAKHGPERLDMRQAERCCGRGPAPRSISAGTPASRTPRRAAGRTGCRRSAAAPPAPRRGLAAPPRAVLDHRLEGVADRDDPRAERNLLARQPVRIAAAVPALVARAHELRDRQQSGRRGDDPLARERVLRASAPTPARRADPACAGSRPASPSCRRRAAAPRARPRRSPRRSGRRRGRASPPGAATLSMCAPRSGSRSCRVRSSTFARLALGRARAACPSARTSAGRRAAGRRPG